jgi:hypothetical protein
VKFTAKTYRTRKLTHYVDVPIVIDRDPTATIFTGAADSNRPDQRTIRTITCNPDIRAAIRRERRPPQGDDTHE